MIRIQKIKIREFRGIRELDLNLNGQNFVACGPNGTGKSGIVDAIEFALTANISRLSGRGTGGLSVKAHGPHVDKSSQPELASVELEVTIPALQNKTATIIRTIKSPSAPKIVPNEPDVRAVFDEARLHPEFVLSRRNLIQYVLSEPSVRSKEVQALLQLDDVERLRAVLQKIANAAQKQLGAIEREKNTAESQLLLALDVKELGKETVLAAANIRRDVLGLPPLAELLVTTSLKDGLETAAGQQQQSRLAKAQGLNSVNSLKASIAEYQKPELSTFSNAARAAAEALSKDQTILDAVSKESLLQTALIEFDEKACPVCDTPFEAAKFRSLIEQKLESFADVTARKEALVEQLKPLQEAIFNLGSALKEAINDAGLLTTPVVCEGMSALKAMLLENYKQLEAVLPLSATISVLSKIQEIPDLSKEIDSFAKGVASIPEPSKQVAARDYLILADERLNVYKSARQRFVSAQVEAAKAAKVFDTFGKATTKALEKIYEEVEATFASYYQKINQEDESKFTAKLKNDVGLLELDVDFYGRGQFPPGAYHSEGHQDGMGICLYLALMKHLQSDAFVLAVLDDVLMSVDSGHRRHICTLLKSEFPNTQFIFTTHDEIWLRHMTSEGLVKKSNCAHFRTWSVELGPSSWENKDVWTEIDNDLDQNDVRSAAALLRHYLEFYFKEACERLRASVEFHGDAQFTFGELFPNAVGQLGDLFKKAKAAANSLNQQERVQAILAIEVTFSEAKKLVDVDKWQVNAAVHFNEWADLGPNDFRPVVSAFKNFIRCFECATCEKPYYVLPQRGGNKESVRCGCGEFLNLLSKTA